MLLLVTVGDNTSTQQTIAAMGQTVPVKPTQACQPHRQRASLAHVLFITHLKACCVALCLCLCQAYGNLVSH
jgi:hypothetical protein